MPSDSADRSPALDNQLLMAAADARHIPLSDNVVQCVVTSPPYWGLRKYAGEQDLIWEVGPVGIVRCGFQNDHKWNGNGLTREHPDRATIGKDSTGSGLICGPRDTQASKIARGAPAPLGATCGRCGAWRGGYGLEPNIEMYVAHTVEILREIRRVLRPDGVVFWNIGDSYANDAKWGGSSGGKHVSELHGNTGIGRQKQTSGLKAKDLCLIPARVALAAQADGWWVRSMIIWAKPNPMPESVTDRPTDAYEHIIMLTKSERYFWDADAVAEPVTQSTLERVGQDVASQIGSHRVPGKTNGTMKAVARLPKFGGDKYGDSEDAHHRTKSGNEYAGALTRNLRNVWTFATQPYTGAHFATFPEELPRRCIMAGTKKGDLVLDPFGGSGTTGRVAVEIRRRCVLLDLAYSSDYGPLAVKRTTNVQLEAFA